MQDNPIQLFSYLGFFFFSVFFNSGLTNDCSQSRQSVLPQELCVAVKFSNSPDPIRSKQFRLLLPCRPIGHHDGSVLAYTHSSTILALTATKNDEWVSANTMPVWASEWVSDSTTTYLPLITRTLMECLRLFVCTWRVCLTACNYPYRRWWKSGGGRKTLADTSSRLRHVLCSSVIGCLFCCCLSGFPPL